MTRIVEMEIYEVDPARLAPGAWCHRTERQIGQGDIDASYSAERIGMNQPVRRPFSWKGALWICVGTCWSNGEVRYAEAYRLVPEAHFTGMATNYAEKTTDGDAARADPNGFYHGMKVRSGGVVFVLCGPPARFVPGKGEQLALF